MKITRFQLLLALGLITAFWGTSWFWRIETLARVPLDAGQVGGPAAILTKAASLAAIETTADNSPVTAEEHQSQQSAKQQQAFQALPKTEQESLWSAFASARRAVQPLTDHEASLPHNKGVRYFAQNPGQQLTARFLDGTARIESGRGGKWAATLGLAGAAKTKPVLTKERVEYRHANGITEWYENRAEGIEHAFTVSRRPDKTSDELRLALALQGVEARPGEGEHTGTLSFNDSTTGAPVLSYGTLKVWDATGRELAARYETRERGLDIVVADAGAVYPVTIDPLIATLEAKLGPAVPGDGRGGDELGYSVALDGDTALLGAPGDDTATFEGFDKGSAYVFVRNATVWSLQAKLRASDAQSDDSFGAAVALHGGTALIGAWRGKTVSGAELGSAYVFVRSGTVWSQQAKLTASDATEGDVFGISVALSENTALIGAYGGNSGAGSAYVFVRSGTVWSQQAELTASDAMESDAFGCSVALSGNTALVGASAGDLTLEDSTGCAYVFTRSGTAWSQQAKLTANDAAPYDEFGSSVALDGETALVGALGDNAYAGSAYVFVRNGKVWSQQTKLTTSIETEYYFGSSVALDGNTALVGAKLDEDRAGAAYVFVRSGSVWSQQAKLVGNVTLQEIYFGFSVALDGNTALVGAPGGFSSSNTGSAHAFTRIGSVWSRQSNLAAGDAVEVTNFGNSVAINGNTALIGVNLEITAAGPETGSAYVFTRNSTTWSQQARLAASDAQFDDRFGSSVALFGDTALVGAHLDDPTRDVGIDRKGSVYVFTRSGSAWSEQAKLTANDGEEYDYFGFSVALFGDTALVGAYGNGTIASGSVYVFTRSSSVWSQQAKLTANDAASHDCFGCSVALSGNTALVGARADGLVESGPITTHQGSAYVFIRSGTTWSQQSKLTVEDATEGAQFGNSVALDGNTALIGAEGAITAPNERTGSAYIFSRSNSVWSQQAKLVGDSVSDHDQFGFSVALSGDLAIVGCHGADTAAGNNAGSAYAFIRNSKGWSQQTKLTVNDASADDYFGISVALSGSTALIGADLDDSPANSIGDARLNHGSVYVFNLEFRSPEIGISGKGINIGHGDVTPSLADNTDYGGIPLSGGAVAHTFTITNSGIGNLSLTGISRVRLSSSNSSFSITQQPISATVTANGGTQTFQITFDPISTGLHTATVSIDSDDENESPFEFRVSGMGVIPPSFITQPASQLLQLGSSVIFSGMGAGEPVITYQWKKGTANIVGAMSDSFTIPVTKAADAAAYSVVAQNGVGNPVVSDPAYLGLVTLNQGTQVIKVGGSLRLNCTAVAPKVPGVRLHYLWKRGGTALTDGTVNGAIVSGATKSALSITKLGTGDSGSYTCEVTLETPNATSGAPPKITDPITNGSTMVNVVDAVPDVAALPPESVSVSEPIDMMITATNSPTNFSATGLPAGLKFDPKTGRLTGKPTTPSKRNATNTAYIPSKISFKATNPFGTSVAEDFYLTIEPLEAGVVGTFSGLVARSGHSNFGMGGHVKITVAASGIVTGDVTLAGQKHSLVGSLDVSLGNNPTFDLIVKRTPASLGNLRLTGNISPSDDLLSGTITDDRFEMLEGVIDLGDPTEPDLINGTMQAARFRSPRSLVLRPDGAGYVADTGNHVIRFVDPDSGQVSTFVGNTTAGFADGTGTAASFNGPEGLALDNAGNLYIADTGNSTIRKVTPAGVVTTFAGAVGQVGIRNGTGTNARFSEPCALCFDPAGNLIVADRGNHMIRKITPAGVVTTLAGKADAAGHKEGSGIAAQFDTPSGITYDPVLKALFVADSLNRVIRKVTLTGAVTTYAGSPRVQGEAEGLFANTRFIEPVGIASLGNGTLIVADTLLVQLNTNGTSGVISEMLDTLSSSDNPTAIAYNAEDESFIVAQGSLHSLASYQADEPRTDALVSATRNPWITASNAPEQGLYNASITISTPGDASYPQGSGYAQVSISKTGTANWTGKAADGTDFTFSTFLDADLHIPLHASLYKNTGSLQGDTFINPTTKDLVNHTTPAFDWYKIPQPLSSTDRSYKNGFYRHELEVSGGKYTPNDLHGYLGLSSSPATMKLDFTASLIAAFEQSFTLADPNTVSITTPVKSTTLKIDPKTGIFTGSFKEGTPAVTVPFAGILINYEAGVDQSGHGHYLLPESSAATAPIRSASMTLVPNVGP